MDNEVSHRIQFTTDELSAITDLVVQEAERVTDLAFMAPVVQARVERALWWRTLANKLKARRRDTPDS
jgi:hypothetical protein